MQETMPKPNTKLHLISHRETPQGVRVDLTMYVYPDGHGNLGGRDGTNQPVNDAEQAIEVFAKLWRHKCLAATKAARSK